MPGFLKQTDSSYFDDVLDQLLTALVMDDVLMEEPLMTDDVLVMEDALIAELLLCALQREEEECMRMDSRISRRASAFSRTVRALTFWIGFVRGD